MLVSGGERRVFTRRDGLPDNDIFSIQETRSGDLLIGARNGLAVMHGGSFRVYRPEDRLNRFNVYDALEDGAGRIWLATAAGMARSDGGRFAIIQPADPVLNASDGDAVPGTGTEPCGPARSAKACGASGAGAAALHDGGRAFERCGALDLPGPDGTLWIGTFGGGLNSFRDGRFLHYTQKDGLLSDNVVKIIDDGASLWLATTRGICRLWKSQLREFAAGRRKTLDPLNYGVADGLRSAQCAPEYPASAGGVRLREGAILVPDCARHGGLRSTGRDRTPGSRPWCTWWKLRLAARRWT